MSIDGYIKQAWTSLRREIVALTQASDDPKHQGASLLYISPLEKMEDVREKLTAADQTDAVRVLPEDRGSWPDFQGPHGLLYLPCPYIVPGGRFNEMYGWDSYFINLGLLAEGMTQEAKDMVDNHLYQVRHYGHVLNANRTYYLSRSQPPFLATMVRDVFAVTKDRDWLVSTLDELESTYIFWTSTPHLTKQTGLSRYYDLGEGPAPEVLTSEKDEQGQTHYQRIEREFAELSTADSAELGYNLELYFDSQSSTLTPLFYKGDRTMRESGFDPSDRFGRFNVDIVHYNPVCLNSLLYRYELDMSELYSVLGRDDKGDHYSLLADRRKALMSRYLWNSQRECFEDYNFLQGKGRDYPFATSFFPLWTGWATEEMALAMSQAVEQFLAPGGILTSTNRSGNQWDRPFGWAPLQLVSAEGLDRYGFKEQAVEIAGRFTGLVEQEYSRTGTILEKYDLENMTAEVSENVEFGYSSNEIGFGWTNAVYLKLKRLGLTKE